MVRAVLLTASLCAFTGCGHTLITASDKRAVIYADGRALGRGEASITRMGFPGSITLEARSRASTVTEVIDRHFTGTTVVLGLFTYGTGLLWAWQYPEQVFLQLPKDEHHGTTWETPVSAWDQAPNSAWDGFGQPPNGGRHEP